MRISRRQREALNGHRAGVAYLTGLSGAGKSTLAALVEHRLHELGMRTYVLDGEVGFLSPLPRHDAFADSALQRLRWARVDLSAVKVLDEADTGLATIAVAAGGENCIIVAPGANRLVEAAWVSPQQLSESRMLLLQMEVPVAESMLPARRAKGRRLHRRTMRIHQQEVAHERS